MYLWHKLLHSLVAQWRQMLNQMAKLCTHDWVYHKRPNITVYWVHRNYRPLPQRPSKSVAQMPDNPLFNNNARISHATIRWMQRYNSCLERGTKKIARQISVTLYELPFSLSAPFSYTDGCGYSKQKLLKAHCKCHCSYRSRAVEERKLSS